MQTWLVTYDISDPKRLREVYLFLRGWGDHVQLSVFVCELDASGFMEVWTELHDRIHHEDDQILFFELGPADGRVAQRTRALGRPMGQRKKRRAIIV